MVARSLLDHQGQTDLTIFLASQTFHRQLEAVLPRLQASWQVHLIGDEIISQRVIALLQILG